jgi:hypothetical protein
VQAGGFGRSFRLHGWAAEVLAHLAAGQPAPLLAALQALDAERGEADLQDEAEVAAARALGWCFLGRADLAPLVATGPPGPGWWAWVQARRAETVDTRRQALAAIARHWPAAQGVMGCRRRVLQAGLETTDLTAAEALVAELHDRALAPLARRAHLLAARAALAVGAHGSAIAHAHQALNGAAAVDPWTDEPAAQWLEAAAVLRAAQAPVQADEALARGRRWLAEAAQALPAGDVREAFLMGQVLHRALAGS